jgi:uncharacterized protein (DUF58 family)
MKSVTAQALLQQVEWTSLKRLDGLLQGDYRTLFRGFGIDLLGLREYQPHDDVRHIDWNVTARSQVPYVKQFSEDREITAWFLVDHSASMGFGSGEYRKSEVVIEHIALLARLLTRHGNRVGCIIYRGKDLAPSVLPAATGRKQVLVMLDQLLKPPKANSSSLGQFLQAAGGILKRRSLIFFASDLQSDDEIEKPLAQLSKRHELIVLRAQDALEAALPNLGLITLQDAESGEQLQVDTSDPRLRERFAALHLRREMQTDQLLKRWAISQLVMQQVEDLIEFIRARQGKRL